MPIIGTSAPTPAAAAAAAAVGALGAVAPVFAQQARQSPASAANTPTTGVPAAKAQGSRQCVINAQDAEQRALESMLSDRTPAAEKMGDLLKAQYAKEECAPLKALESLTKAHENFFRSSILGGADSFRSPD